MRILLLSHIFPPATDGGSKIIAKVGEYLADKKCQTLAVTTDCHTTDQFVIDNPHPFPSSPAIIRLPIHRLHRRLPKPIFRLIPFLKTLFIIKKFKPDWIITGPFPTTISIYALILKHIFHTKLCLIPCFHQYDVEFNQKHLIYCLHHSDLICTLTKHESLILNTVYHIPDTRLFTMHAGIDRSLLIKNLKLKIKNSKNIVFLGNFAAHKRVELLIKAFSKLQIVNIKLVLCGQKTLYWPQIQKIINSQPANIKKNIIIHLKNYTPEDLKNYLSPGSVLVLPSIHESFGLVFIESMARGIPVIGTDIPPVKELLNLTGGGITFKKDNLIDLQKKVELLLTQPKIYLQLSKNGYSYVKNNLTWDRIVNNLWARIKL